MKKLTLFICLIIVAANGFAQTNVSGGIYSNTVWTLANSPYIVTDTVVVFPGVTLTIEPGVVVKFEDHKRLEIRNAKLIAQGTATDSITFTSNAATPTTGIWGDIYLNYCPNSLNFNYCNILYSDHGFDCHTNVILGFKNSSFEYNNFGVSTYFSSPDNTINLDSCDFKNNTKGVYSESQYYTNIHNCNFQNNSTGVYGYYRINIYNSNLSKNQTGAYCGGYSVIANSIIDSNSVEGLNMTYTGSDIVTNCVIKHNGIGLLSGYNNTIKRNIIENNIIGIKMEFSNTIYCNKICNNTTYDLYYNTAGNANISNNYWCTTDSAIIASHIYDGYDNISLGLVTFLPTDTLLCYQDICSANFYLYPDTALAHHYFAVNMASGVPPLSYLWSWGDGSPDDNAATPSHVYSTAGFYNICLTITDSIGCTHTYCDSSYLAKNSDAMIYVNVVLPAGIIENPKNESLLIYPNPAHDKIEAKSEQSELRGVTIYNMQGLLLRSLEVNTKATTIDISGFAKGIYIVKLQTENGVVNKKLIIQ